MTEPVEGTRPRTMVKLTAEQITTVVERILCAAGATQDESRQVGIRLANANLVGHDSHGLIRVCQYADQLADGTIKTGAELTEVVRNGAVAIFDANLGFGQVAAEKTTREGIRIAGELGVAVIGLRNVAHVGRVGDWAEMAAQAGVISLHYVNSPATPGVTPFGGIERRMATNPVCIGYPVKGRDPVIADMTTSSVAEGKLRVARAAGDPVPEGWIVDKHGQNTTNPDDFYAGGALLTMGAHKGYALSLAIDLLAGAFTGGKTAGPSETVNRNNMLSVFIDPRVVGLDEDRDEIASAYLDWIKDCPARDPDKPVQLPGEPEATAKRHRTQSGIDIPQGVWDQVLATARHLGIEEGELVPQ